MVKYNAIVSKFIDIVDHDRDSRHNVSSHAPGDVSAYLVTD